MGLLLLLLYKKYVITISMMCGVYHLIFQDVTHPHSSTASLAVRAHPVLPVQIGKDILRLQIQISVQVLEILLRSLSSAVVVAREQCPQVECYLVLKHRRYDCHDNMNINAAE